VGQRAVCLTPLSPLQLQWPVDRRRWRYGRRGSICISLSKAAEATRQSGPSRQSQQQEYLRREVQVSTVYGATASTVEQFGAER
jgi:hypothetical protein